ncbi:hypothetical protein [Streptomyces sp. NBC_00102]|uniref:hypothetical protein n=1 Tax=Streptomyces sp. NBC_00102 TaxID=2975652 RepID=UPI00224CC704|nr:hypothetical protein [Streptomyces sp. NBC_00102]MCX5401428.1 hypothetical protein [Streptomyces sp. NBC_00102]
MRGPKPKRDWRSRLGRPAAVVLYRTPVTWRFAIHFEPGGVLDGALRGASPGGSPESAQEAMRRWVEDTFQRPVGMAWTPTDAPDWWAGDITDSDSGTPIRDEPRPDAAPFSP